MNNVSSVTLKLQIGEPRKYYVTNFIKFDRYKKHNSCGEWYKNIILLTKWIKKQAFDNSRKDSDLAYLVSSLKYYNF